MTIAGDKGTFKPTVYRDPASLANRFGDQLMDLIATSAKPVFHLAISGGSTPELLFSVLAGKYGGSPLWDRIVLWWVDERMVPPEDPESNFGKANRLLLSRAVIPGGNIRRIHGESNAAAEVIRYGNLIRSELTYTNGFPSFDLVLLGMGDDGHTASIFPGQTDLILSGEVCAESRHPVSGQRRITLTLKTINNASRVAFLVTGTGKAARMAEIASGSKSGHELPAGLVCPLSGDLSWHADEAAASQVL